MKIIHQVAIYDYDGDHIYGTFESEEIAKHLCEEVNEYLKKKDVNADLARVMSLVISDECDSLLRYVVTLDLKDPNEIRVEEIVPTYNHITIWENVESINERLKGGYTQRYIRQSGTTEVEAKNKVLKLYNLLQEENLVNEIIDILNKEDKKRGYTL